MNTAERRREQLHEAAAVLKGASADVSIRWATIRFIEDAWFGQPGKVKERNRRSVLKYLFGTDSTKNLSDAQVLALHDWLHNPDSANLDEGIAHDVAAQAEVQAILTAALVAAGQLELQLPA